MPAEKVDLNTIPYAPPIPREPPPGLADTAFPVNTHLDRIFHPAGRPRASGRACGNTVHLGERRLFPERPRPLPPGIEIPGYLRSPLPGAQSRTGRLSVARDFNPGRQRPLNRTALGLALRRGSRGLLRLLRRLFRMELLPNLPPHERPEDVLQILQLRLAHPLHAAEGLDQQLAAAGADAGQLVEAAVERAGRAAAAVAGGGETVGLLADLLEQPPAGSVPPQPEPRPAGRPGELRLPLLHRDA